ncbi:MAG: hypothetical protein U5L46_01735 [Agrobacterium sp.]|nr:hypothetical protein [Agrobacterium sp.]
MTQARSIEVGSVLMVAAPGHDGGKRLGTFSAAIPASALIYSRDRRQGFAELLFYLSVVPRSLAADRPTSRRGEGAITSLTSRDGTVEPRYAASPAGVTGYHQRCLPDRNQPSAWRMRPRRHVPPNTWVPQE